MLRTHREGFAFTVQFYSVTSNCRANCTAQDIVKYKRLFLNVAYPACQIIYLENHRHLVKKCRIVLNVVGIIGIKFEHCGINIIAQPSRKTNSPNYAGIRK